MASDPEPCFNDLHIVKNEVYDVDAMNHLCNYDGLSTDMKTKLKKYKKNRKNINHVQVVYSWGKNMATLKFGRLIGAGLMEFDKEVRATLADKYYFDLDMANAQPVILSQLCKKNGWACPLLNEYVTYRKEKIAQLMFDMGVSRDECKEFFIQLLFGSKVAWVLKHPFMISMTKEMNEIMTNVARTYPYILAHCQKIYKKDPSKKGKNPEAGCIAHVVQNEERLILMAIDASLKSQGRSMDVFIHDGGLVRKLENELEFPVEIIQCCEKDVMDSLGYQISLVIKSMADKKISFQGKARKYLPNDTLVSDSYAAKKFVELLGDAIVLDVNTGRWIFDTRTGLWSQDPQTLRSYLNIYASEMVFYQIGSSGDDVFDYSGKESNIKNMIVNIDRHLTKVDFLGRKGSSAIGKFLFEDGIYDMKTKAFTEGFNPDIFFFHRILRKYSKPDAELCKKVNKILFEDPYIAGEQDIQATWFKRGLARALYGEVERHKNFYITVGQPNCGRGLLTGALLSAYDGYVTTFSPNALIYNPHNSSDEAKKLAWVIPIINTRLAIGNEIIMDPKKFIDGTLLKTLAGGGDTIKARLNFKDDAEFPMRTILFMQTNDISAIKPADEAVMNRGIINELKKSYKESPNPSNPNEMLQDSGLKELFKTEEYRNAVFHLMADIYGEWVDAGCPMTKPDSLKQLTSEWVESTTSIRSLIEQKYEITKMEDDWISSREIIDYLKQRGCVESETKVGRELTNLGCPVIIKKEGGVSKRVRLGIRNILDALMIE